MVLPLAGEAQHLVVSRSQVEVGGAGRRRRGGGSGTGDRGGGDDAGREVGRRGKARQVVLFFSETEQVHVASPSRLRHDLLLFLHHGHRPVAGTGTAEEMTSHEQGCGMWQQDGWRISDAGRKRRDDWYQSGRAVPVKEVSRLVAFCRSSAQDS
jgi:hypothetical protein